MATAKKAAVKKTVAEDNDFPEFVFTTSQGDEFTLPNAKQSLTFGFMLAHQNTTLDEIAMALFIETVTICGIIEELKNLPWQEIVEIAVKWMTDGEDISVGE